MIEQQRVSMEFSATPRADGYVAPVVFRLLPCYLLTAWRLWDLEIFGFERASEFEVSSAGSEGLHLSPEECDDLIHNASQIIWGVFLGISSPLSTGISISERHICTIAEVVVEIEDGWDFHVEARDGRWVRDLRTQFPQARFCADSATTNFE